MSAPTRGDPVSAAAPGLHLHFNCPSCHHTVVTALQSGSSQLHCPTCAARVQVPEINPDIAGVEVIERMLQGMPRKKPWRTRCPVCHKPIIFQHLPAGAFRREFACPSCAQSLGVRLVSINESAATSERFPSDASPDASLFDVKSNPGTSSAWLSNGPSVPREPPPVQDPPVPSAEPFYFDDVLPADKAEAVVVPEGVYYDPKQKPPPLNRRPSRPFLSLRATRRLVLFSIWWGPLCAILFVQMILPLRLAGNLVPLGALSLLWGIVSSIFVWRLSRYLTAAFVSRMWCPGCHELIECKGVWNVGQFHDHRQRHVLLAKDPFTGSWIGHTNCPFCEATIFV